VFVRKPGMRPKGPQQRSAKETLVFSFLSLSSCRQWVVDASPGGQTPSRWLLVTKL
jgi:hypothetical protein